jgi:hypothetical protein
MIGSRIEHQPRFPWMASLFLVAAAGLVAWAAAVRNPQPAIGAVMPLLLGAGLWLAREPAFSATITEEALVVAGPEGGNDTIVPYAEIEGVRGIGRPLDLEKPGKRSFPIHVVYPGGSVRIPAGINLPCEDVYRFLISHLPEHGSLPTAPALVEYLQQQGATFGPDRVYAYCAARRIVPWRTYGAFRTGCLAVVAGGTAWVILGLALPDSNHWTIIGGLVAFFSLLLWAATFASNQVVGGPAVKNWQQSALVISPLGLAMVQGVVEGSIRWDEIREVRFQDRVRSFGVSAEVAGVGIHLLVEGARIVIPDIYDRPLQVIYRRIIAFHNPPNL